MDHLIGGLGVEQLLLPRRRARHRLAVPIGGIAGAAIVGLHHLAAIVGAEDDLAVAVLDIVDQRRGHRPAIVGEDRIGVGQLEHRGVAGAQRDRQIAVIIADAELGGVGDDLVHAGLRRGADGHQVARLLDAPAHRLGARIFAVEVAEAFVAQPRPLPHAEWRIDDDRGRGHAVFERRHIDDRLERRSRLAQRLGRAIVGGADHVEAALHRHHPAGVDFLGDEAAADFGNGAQRIAVRAHLLDDDDHARAEAAERRAANPAHRLHAPPKRAGCRSIRRKSRSARWLPDLSARPPSSSRESRCPSAATRSWVCQSPLTSMLRPVSRQPRPPSNCARPSRKRLGRRVLHLGNHRRAHPQAAGIDAVRAVIGVLAEPLHQVAADLFHEIAALVAELGAAAIADGAERRGCRGSALLFGDVAVVGHFPEDIVAAGERLRGGAHRVVIARRLGQHREIGRLRQASGRRHPCRNRRGWRPGRHRRCGRGRSN